MARPKNLYPTPFLRQRKDAWQIHWTYDSEEYAMSIGVTAKEEAKITCAAVAIALAEKEDWPVDLVTMPAVKRYLAKKSGNEIHSDDKHLIQQYAEHLRINSRSNWNITIKSHLLAASEFTGKETCGKEKDMTAHAGIPRTPKRLTMHRSRLPTPRITVPVASGKQYKSGAGLYCANA